MSFELFCMGTIGLLFGLAVAFLGYRLLWIVLPIWGFFFGLALGAQTIQAILGDAFFGTVTSWVVGFIVGAIFAVFSYLFYFVAVAILSGSLGYSLTVGLLAAIGLDFGFLVWLIAIVVAVIVAFLVLRFNIQKYAVIVITALGGAGVIVFIMLAAFEGVLLTKILSNPVMTAISNNWLYLLLFAVVAIGGIVVQLRASQAYEVEEYNRYYA